MVSFNLELKGNEYLKGILVSENDGSVELKLIQNNIPIQSLYFERLSDFVLFCKILKIYDS